MRLTAIANPTSMDPGLAKGWLNCAYINLVTKLNQKSKMKKWYASGNFQPATMLWDIGCPQLEEEID